MKDKMLFFKNVLKKLGKDFKPSVKELKVQKSSFSLCDEYIVKIMSRVLVGFGETSVFRGRTRTWTDADTGHGFFERLPHKSPFGANIISKTQLLLSYMYGSMFCLENIGIIARDL